MHRRSAGQIALVLLAAGSLAACATGGVLRSTNVTNVELASANYKVVARDVSGEAAAGYLFGASASRGQDIGTVALIRVKGDGQLYKHALEDLWAAFEAEHGPVTGRALALVNIRHDVDCLNVLGIYTQARMWVRADVVEFVKP
jgi:hypothetical protein